MFPELGFTEVVDDTGDTEAQVQEIDAPASVIPGQNLVNGVRKILGCIRKFVQRDRIVELGRLSERYCEHDKIGAPSHARRIESPIRIVLPCDDTRNRSAVGKFATVLFTGPRHEAFNYVLVTEGGVSVIDAGVQNANENPFSWCDIGAELQFQMRVSFGSADRGEAPLPLNGGIFRVSCSFFGGKLLELLAFEAAGFKGGDTLRRIACGKPNGYQGKRDAQAGK